MYLAIFLIISSMPGAILRKPWASNGKYCGKYLTQGFDIDKTLIRINEKESVWSIVSDIRKTTYEWNIVVSTYGSEANSICNNVPCYLIAWSSKQMLKNQLMQLSEDDMSGNFLSINNSLIQPNIIYTINVLIQQSGKTIGTHCFELRNGNQPDGIIKIPKKDIPKNVNDTQECAINECTELDNNDIESDEINYKLYLIGPDRITSSNTLIINAVPVGVGANVTYEWKLKDSDDENFQMLNNTGSRLEIPSKTLNGNKTYAILCVLLQNGDVIVSETHIVYVAFGEIIVRLPINFISTALGASIKIVPIVDIPDEMPYEITWTCTKKSQFQSNLEDCGTYNGTNNTNFLYIEHGFQKAGLYFFELNVLNIGKHEKLVANVSVMGQSPQTIEMNAIPTWLTQFQPLKISARVHKVHTGCLLKWQSKGQLYNKNNYVELKLAQNDFNVEQRVYVKRDSFLYELGNHSKERETHDISLNIPSNALKSTIDVKYLIELEAKCEKFTTYVGLEIVFEAPPTIGSLRIKPLSGEALLTIFKFEVPEATDDVNDMPFTYLFGWTSPGNSSTKDIVYFVMLQNFYLTETPLPYIEEYSGELQSVIKICNSKNSCNVEFGPTVSVIMPEEISQSEHMAFKEQLVRNLVETDYEKFAIYLKIYLPTYKWLRNESFGDDMQQTVNNLISQEIQLLLDRKVKQNIHKFIACLSTVGEMIKTTNEVIKNLMKLRGVLVNEEISAKIVTDYDEALEVIEQVNKQVPSSVTLEDIKKYFEATEFIITTSEDAELAASEKDNFIVNLEKHLSELCVLLYKDSVKNYKFKLKTSYIIIEKFTNSYFRNNFYVPNIDNQWQSYIQIRLNQSLFMSIRDKTLCITKAVMQDYLNHDGFIYFAKLFTSDLQKMTMVDISNTVTKSIKMPDQFICSTYYEDKWNQCRRGSKRENHLICNCHKMGYYKIDKSESGGSEQDSDEGYAGGNEAENGGTNGNEEGNNNGNNGKNPDGNGATSPPRTGGGGGNGGSNHSDNDEGGNNNEGNNGENLGGRSAPPTSGNGDGGSNGGSNFNSNGNNGGNSGNNNDEGGNNNEGNTGETPGSNSGTASAGTGDGEDNGGSNSSDNSNNEENGGNNGEGGNSNEGNYGENPGGNSAIAAPGTADREGNDGSSSSDNVNKGGNGGNENNNNGEDLGGTGTIAPPETRPRGDNTGSNSSDNGNNGGNDNSGNSSSGGQQDSGVNNGNEDDNETNNQNGNPTQTTPTVRVTEPLGPDDDNENNENNDENQGPEKENAGNNTGNGNDGGNSDGNPGENTPDVNNSSGSSGKSPTENTTPSGRTNTNSESTGNEENNSPSNNSGDSTNNTNAEDNNNNGGNMTPAGSNNNTPTTSTPDDNNSNNNTNNSESEIGGNEGKVIAINITTSAKTPTTPPRITTSDIRTAGIGSSISLGDQISFAVIGLCILGTGGLVLFGLISKRVQRSNPVENQPPSFPMYADIFQKENMHGDFQH